MGRPTWHAKTRKELRALVHAVWEGRAVATWQLEGTPHLERLFPGYSHFVLMKAGDETGSAPLYWETAEAAQWFASLPWPAGACALLPDDGTAAPAATAGELPPFEKWELLSWDEWHELRRLLGYPKPKPEPPPPPAEAG